MVGDILIFSLGVLVGGAAALFRLRMEIEEAHHALVVGRGLVEEWQQRAAEAHNHMVRVSSLVASNAPLTEVLEEIERSQMEDK